jgi:pimeloyl-ACP methyl ester carboxylesterase
MTPLFQPVVAEGSLTPKADKEPIKVKIGRPRGTVYWGGAGLNGPYISDQVAAFQEVGITHVWVGKRTQGDMPDAIRSALDLRLDSAGNEKTWMIEGLNQVDADQFNLIGYSYGSLMAAHTAMAYARYRHIVDHLVLIASPIDKDFLLHLQHSSNIRRVIVLNLTKHGDPIYAGMPMWKLWLSKGRLEAENELSQDVAGFGHFYYRPNTRLGRQRRRELAKYLYQEGLR